MRLRTLRSPRGTRRVVSVRARAALLALLVTFAAAGADARRAGAAAAPASPPQTVLQLHGDTVTVLYSEGALERAANLQQRFEEYAAVLSAIAKRTVRLRVYALGPDDWRASGFARPYGLPQSLDAATLALPAWGDEASLAAARSLLGGEPPPADGLLARGTPAEAGSLFVADVLGELEAARAFVAAENLSGDEPWIAEVLAHVVARLAWARAEPGRIPEIASLFDRVAAAHGGPRAFPLADFRGASLPFDRWLWYEASFLRGADPIFRKDGERGTRKLLAAHAKRGEPFRRADLEKRYPGLSAWLAATFAP